MSRGFTCAGRTHPGREREQNEDAWAVDAETGLVLVADGMGGYAGGAVAAAFVAETFPSLVTQRIGEKALDVPETAAALKECVAESSEALREQGAAQPELCGMGATLVAALLRDNLALIVHMGDSRAYQFHSGALERLTADHSFAELLIASGDLTEEEAAHHPAQHQITRYAGMDGPPQPETRLVERLPGDLFMLCSDGLYGEVEAETISGILGTDAPLEARCEQLIGAANAAGGHDNITVVLAQ